MRDTRAELRWCAHRGIVRNESTDTAASIRACQSHQDEEYVTETELDSGLRGREETGPWGDGNELGKRRRKSSPGWMDGCLGWQAPRAPSSKELRQCPALKKRERDIVTELVEAIPAGQHTRGTERDQAEPLMRVTPEFNFKGSQIWFGIGWRR
ncbi:hypothetical protein BDZ91DRAFT_766591 [Kalaharituber pfeilii]|nr:hypothetical protein BDZ91DRAFT_766591 [Kalaharituber pfeilii]